MPVTKIALLGLAIVAACMIGVWVYRAYFDNYHLATVQPGVLYRDGFRDVRQFTRALASQHIRTVICLVDDHELESAPFEAEDKICQEQGAQWIHLPVRLGGWPTSEQLQRFLLIVADPARQPVMVHCAQGVRRTGMFVAAYQESVMHLSPEQARSAMLTFGHSKRTVGDVQRFIDAYDPAERKMTKQLEMSQE